MAIALSALGCADLLGVPTRPYLVDEPASVDELPTRAGTEPAAAPEERSAPLGAAGFLPPLDGWRSASPPAAATTLDDGGRSSSRSEDAGAARDGGGVAPDAGLDAGLRCSGVDLFGVCWYLGVLGASCTETCSGHGGPSSAAAAHVGTAARGGSLDDCSAILLALGEAAPALQATRADGRGLGCHVFGLARTPYWLSSPDFEPGAQQSAARIACGCRE
jgi:hypothetical protein